MNLIDYKTKRSNSLHEESIIGGRTYCSVCGFINQEITDIHNKDYDNENQKIFYTIMTWHGDHFEND